MATDNTTSAAKDITGHTSAGNGTTKLNAGQTVRYDGAKWAYASGEDYQWTANADHRFFGWLSKDGVSSLTADGFFGTGFSYSSGVLTVPAKTMTMTDGSLDFAYSDVVTRKASEADYSPVELTLNHLFTSFSLSAHNYTSSQIVIKSVKLYGIRNQKSATVTFGTDSSSVAYSAGSTVYDDTDCFKLVTETSGITIAADAHKTNIIKGASDTPKYILMWPQTADELTAASSSTTEFIPTGTNPAYMEVVYSQGGGADLTVKVPFPFEAEDGWAWAPGSRHNLELAFTKKFMLLNVYAGNWNETEPVIDYDGTVAVTDGGKLRVSDDCNCVISGDTVYFKPGFPIILEFQIDQPVNSTWIVSKTGDFDAFDIDNFDDDSAVMGDENDTAEGLIITGNTARITIYPRITDLLKDEYKLNLSFYVRLNSGEMVNINDLIYDDDSPMTFILLKD